MRRWTLRWVIAASILWIASPAWGQVQGEDAPASVEERAATHFDRAVEHFRSADFEAAARGFMMADQLQPDGDTLSNALRSAQSSGSHLLVALVSERAIEKHQEDPALVRLARSALAMALPHLGRLRLSCSPAPCEILLDDQPVSEGPHLVDPGTHRLRARFDNQENPVEQVVQIAAGTSYVFALEPPRQSEQTRELEPVPAPIEERRVEPAPNDDFWSKSGDEVIFVAGVSVTAALAGVMIWSGTDVLKSKRRLPNEPTTEERSGVQAKITRTDVLLGATVAGAAFSTVWGWLATDFRSEAPRPDLSVLPSGAWCASVRGNF